MSWARRLKRVFGIEIETCARCGGTLRIIASIEEPAVIAQILSHLRRTAPQPPAIGRCRPTPRSTMQTGSGRAGG
jgi:hypothetical protein